MVTTRPETASEEMLTEPKSGLSRMLIGSEPGGVTCVVYLDLLPCRTPVTGTECPPEAICPLRARRRVITHLYIAPQLVGIRCFWFCIFVFVALNCRR